MERVRSKIRHRSPTPRLEFPVALEVGGPIPLGGQLQRELELVITAPAGGINESRQSRLTQVLSDAHAQPRALRLERLP